MGAKYTNGGIVKFTKRNTQIETTGNTVVFINDGDGSVGYALYKLDSFIGTVNIAAAYSEKINPYTGIFVATSANMLRSKYSFGYKRTLTHLRQDRIMLPKSPNNQPNWDYMEQYIVNMMKTIEVPDLDPIKSSGMDLKSVKWKDFEIQQVFDQIDSVKGKAIRNYSSGKVPYVTTSAINNGLNNYVSADKELITPGNVITIDPIKGKVFYHSYSFVGRGGAGSAISVLTHTQLNKNIGLFLITMIEANSFLKASYGTQLNGERLKKQKIMLPVTNSNTPNWQFMEDYIKSISNSHLI